MTDLGATANRMGFLAPSGGSGGFKPPPVMYTCIRCHPRGTKGLCWLHCRPSLPLEEIAPDEIGNKMWELCQRCHQRSVDNENKRLFKKLGKEPKLSVEEELQQTLSQLETLKAQLAKMGVKA